MYIIFNQFAIIFSLINFMFFGVKTMKEKPFSLCIIYFVFLQFYGTSCNWVVTATVRDEVTNAGNHFGLCRFNTTKGADKNEPICAKDGEIGGWVDRGVENGQLEQLANGCEYFRKTRVFLCFEAPAGSGKYLFLTITENTKTFCPKVFSKIFLNGYADREGTPSLQQFFHQSLQKHFTHTLILSVCCLLLFYLFILRV